MKKILYLLFLFLTLIGCTVSITNDNTTSTTKFTTTDDSSTKDFDRTSIEETTTSNQDTTTISTTTNEVTTTKEVTTTILKPNVTTTIKPLIDEDGRYSSRDEVALYIYVYGKLPTNYITKEKAYELGWNGGGNLWKITDKMSIGGDIFYNREKLLPSAIGRVYYECDIDYNGGNNRGTKRIVFSNDGLIFYTSDHYESFMKFSIEVLNGESHIRWERNY